ncbi:hypothetical protein [Anthocerotibacter panamensis]|uniref:hypothetical protein n=1 Tax=Anthocerotibacter panamensis TaxID=2857077 RepID=UPI001C407436|nr:hypothetical protein [Anthocerotibacter panamensis]
MPMIERGDARVAAMQNALTQALRERNVQQARCIILQLQECMSRERVASVLWSSIERLAWQEGDSPAIRWMMSNSPSTLKQSLPLR